MTVFTRFTASATIFQCQAGSDLQQEVKIIHSGAGDVTIHVLANGDDNTPDGGDTWIETDVFSVNDCYPVHVGACTFRVTAAAGAYATVVR